MAGTVASDGTVGPPRTSGGQAGGPSPRSRARAVWRSGLVGRRGDGATVPGPAGAPGVLLRLAPALAVLALYGPSVLKSTWILDDRLFIATRTTLDGLGREWVANVAAAAGDDRASSVWRPLVTSLWRVLGATVGMDPGIVRAFNVGVQAIDALLVAACARALGASPVTATGVGVAWGVHAAGVDVVAWGVGGFDLVSTAFTLGSVWILARGGGTRLGAAVAAALTTAAACFAKESALVLAVVLPVLFGWPGLGGTVAAAAAAGAHRAVTGTSLADAIPSAGSLASAWTQGLGWLVGPPAGGLLALFHVDDPATIGRGIATVALVLALGLIVGRSSGPGARDVVRRSTLAVAVAAVAVLPAAVASTTTGVAPARYAHMPAALLLVLLAPALDALPRGARAALAGTWLLVHVPAAAWRLPDWQSERALLEAEVAIDPANPLAHAFRGRDRARGCDAQGFVEWADALDADPGFAFLRQDRYALAQAAFLCGRPDIAEAEVRPWLATHADAPPNAWCLEADALDALGRHDEATEAARRCR